MEPTSSASPATATRWRALSSGSGLGKQMFQFGNLGFKVFQFLPGAGKNQTLDFKFFTADQLHFFNAGLQQTVNGLLQLSPEGAWLIGQRSREAAGESVEGGGG